MHRISSPRWIITERFHNNTISRIFHPTPLSSRNNKKGNSPPFFFFFYLTFQVAWKALFPRSPVPTEDHIVPASINRNQEKVSWRYKLFSFPLKRIHFLKNHLRPWSQNDKPGNKLPLMLFHVSPSNGPSVAVKRTSVLAAIMPYRQTVWH